LAGRAAWTRLTPAASNGGRRAISPVRTSPIALLERRRAPLWMSLVRAAGDIRMSPKAEAAFECLKSHGALFFDELADAARLLRPQLEEALGELGSLGVVNSDSFGGLRALLVPSEKRKPIAGVKRRGKVLAFGMESAGRWSLVRRAPPHQDD